MSRPRQPVRISASLRRRYLAGEFNQGQLAGQLGVKVGRLRKELIRLGLPTYSPAARRRVACSIPVELVEAYVRGELSIDDVAAALGVSYSTARHRLRELGCARTRQPDRIAAGLLAERVRAKLIRLGLPTYSLAAVTGTLPVELVEAYRRGDLSLDDIATALGVRRATVTRQLREQGVHIRNASEAASLRQQHRDASRDQEIQQLRAQGWTLAAIGALEGISRQRVNQILKRAATRGKPG